MRQNVYPDSVAIKAIADATNYVRAANVLVENISFSNFTPGEPGWDEATSIAKKVRETHGDLEAYLLKISRSRHG